MTKSYVPRVKWIKPENPTYSVYNPNPDWEKLGKRWITYALNKWQPTTPLSKELYVAYIPHAPLEIEQGNTTHCVAPTEWDLSKVPGESNLNMGSGNNLRNVLVCGSD